MEELRIFISNIKATMKKVIVFQKYHKRRNFLDRSDKLFLYIIKILSMHQKNLRELYLMFVIF